MPWAANVGSDDEYEALVRRGHLRFLGREDLWMLLLLKEEDTIVGASGLHRIDWSVPKFEIGYWVRTRFAGRGFISEAVEGITRFAFEVLEAERVEIRCDARNIRSMAIPRRLGFAREATLHHEARHHLTNELRDTLVFAKLRSDVEAGQAVGDKPAFEPSQGD
jgi:RimJ/RimL family protein N-acetyltransferase